MRTSVTSLLTATRSAGRLIPRLVPLLIPLLSACASTPAYRPPLDLTGGRNIEVGAAVDVGIGVDTTGERGVTGAMPGTAAYALFRTEAGFDFFGAGRVNGGVSLADGAFAGTLINGGAGLRYRMAPDYLEDMRFSFELWADYLQMDLAFLPASATGPTLPLFQQYVSGMVRAVIAQRAAPGVWVYIAPTTGITLPLHEDERPFFGVAPEIPLGFAFQPFDFMSFVVEGGYSPLIQGAFIGGGMILQL